MKKHLRMILSFTLALAFSAQAGNVYYASPDGTSAGAGTRESPYDIVTACSKLGDNTGDEVKLLAGTYRLGGLSLAKIDCGAKLTGDGANATDAVLDGEGTASSVTVEKGGRLGNLTFSNFCNRAVYSNPTANMTNTIANCAFLTNCVTVSGYQGSAICLGSDGRTVVSNCIFRDNSNMSHGGAIYGVSKASLLLTDSIFTNNQTTASGTMGGACHFECYGDGVEIRKCEFYRNSSMTYGGAVCCRGPGYGLSIRLSVTDSVFENNSSTSCGGAIGQDYDGNARIGLVAGITNCIFRGNASRSGGAFNGHGSTFSGCTFVTNTASTWGGAIIVYSRGSDRASIPEATNHFRIVGCTFLNNVSGVNGSAVYDQDNTDFEITDSLFEGNADKSIGTGGAVSIGSSVVRAVIDRCRFFANTGKSYGSALGFDLSTTRREGVVRNSLFLRQEGKNAYGGALALAQKSIAESCTFISNQTSGVGGAVFSRDGYGTLRNCLFFGNRLTWSQTGEYCDIYGTDLRTKNSDYCCSNLSETFPDERGNRVITNPKFVDGGSDDFRLQKDSPCVNVGTNQDWMVGAHDLQNKRHPYRIEDDTVDIGCYEYFRKRGLRIIFR